MSNKVKPTGTEMAEAEAKYPPFQELNVVAGIPVPELDAIESLLVANIELKKTIDELKDERKLNGGYLHEKLTDPAHPVKKFSYGEWLISVRPGSSGGGIDLDVLSTTLVEFGVDADVVAAAILVSKKEPTKYEYVDVRRKGEKGEE